MSDDEVESEWQDPERDIAQANALRDQARKGGLRFDVFLPPGLAEWVLESVARGAFRDPSEAVFVMLGEQRDLEPHADLRQEILRRSLHAALEDLGPSLSAEEVEEEIRKLAGPREEPAVWIKADYAS